MRRLRLSLLAAAGGVALAATLPAHGQSLVALGAFCADFVAQHGVEIAFQRGAGLLGGGGFDGCEHVFEVGELGLAGGT